MRKVGLQCVVSYARVFATEVAVYPVFFSYSLDKSGFVYRL